MPSIDWRFAMLLDENQYKMIVDCSPNLIWRAGTDGNCDFFNKTWLDFTGRSMEQEIGSGWSEGVHPEDSANCMTIYTTAFAKREPFEMNYRLKRHDGEWRWINNRGAPFFSNDNAFLGYIGSCIDSTEQINGEKFKIMVQTDALTGVFSRQHFMQLANDEFERSERMRLNLCVAMIDIDRFKAINDEYGHQTGDEVLRHFAKSLQKNTRKFDLVGRYGGDEFVVLFANTDLHQANLAMKRLSNVLQAPLVLSDQVSLALSYSFGFAVMQQDADLAALIRIADKSMYQMKRTGNTPI
jgi:diguanylate cyclase (GGDEF)-like protein/PAS domain S-box-containing protein